MIRIRRVARGLAVGLAAVAGACEPSEPVARLASRLDDVRAVEPRRSRLTRHGPCPVAVDRAPPRCAAAADLAREIAGSIELVREVETRTGPDGPVEGLRALATVDALTAGTDRVALDRAVSRLRVAVDVAPDDSGLRNDLAVVLLLRAEATARTWDATEALDQLQRVLDADSSHAPARFNRALALDRLGLVNMATEAWDDVAATDPERAWRDEARVRGMRLNASIDSARVDAPRVDSVLRTAVDLLDGVPYPEGDASPWARVRRDARELDARGEESALILVDALDRPGAGDSRLRAALESYVEGLDLWRDGAFAESQLAYRRARDLVGDGSPEALRLRWRATIGAARQSVYDDAYLEADTSLATVLRESEGARAVETRGHALWALGLSAGRRRAFPAAGSYLAAAESLFAALGQREEFGALRSIRAELLGADGALDAALEQLVAALPLFGRDGGNMHQNLLSITGRLVGARHPRAAVWFHREGLHLSEARRNAQFRVEALIRLAQSEARAGDTVRAGALLREARERLPAVRDSAMRRRVRAEYDELVGMHVPGLPAPTRDSLLTEAAEFFRETIPFKMPAILERRGHHRVAEGRTAEGRADLRAAAALVEEQLLAIDNPGVRAGLLQARAAAVDGLVASHLALGDTVAALVDLDRPRASASTRTRGRWDSTSADAREPAMPEGAAIVAYGVIDEAVVAWVVGRRGVSMVRLTIPAPDLALSVDRLRFALRTGSSADAVADVTATLDAALIRPLEPLLQGIERLTVVPDGPLNALPFAALGARPGDLLRRYRLATAPSVAFALDRGAPSSARPVRARSAAPALAVAASAWDVERYPGLPGLPYADGEAAAVAALHGRTALLDPDADRLAAALGDARVFHFAGHGLYRSDRQDLSTLVLPGSAGGLTAARIATLDLSAMELAVLAACSTQQASEGAEGGLSGLTWSFLDAGARGVIGSLWAVPDEATSRVMVALHERLAAGASGPEALRATQLEALRSGEGGWAWAAFRYEGHMPAGGPP